MPETTQEIREEPKISERLNQYIKRIYREDIMGLAPLVCRGGQIAPNPLLEHMIPYQLTFDEQGGDSTAVIAANGTILRTMNVDKSGPVVVHRLKGIATSNEYLLSIVDVEYNRALTNQPIHADTIVGTGAFPYELPIPLLISRTNSLRFDLTDLSGALNTVRLTFEGFRFYFDIERVLFDKMSQANKISRPYWYTTENNVVLGVAGNIESHYLTIIGEADFYLRRIIFKSDGPFRVIWHNMSTGYAYSNSWIHSANWGGNNQNYKDFEPQLMKRRTQIRFDFINLSGAPNRVFLTLAGEHYYYE